MENINNLKVVSNNIMKNQLKEKKRRNKKCFFIICIIIIFFLIIVFNYWRESLESTDIGPHPIFEFAQKDVDIDLNEMDLNQSIIIITLQSKESIVWNDINIQISKDGNNYHKITFDNSTIDVVIKKVENEQGDPRCWEEGESIMLSENGILNWSSGTSFYCKIIHLPTGSTLHDENTLVI
jgi:hypothetical protein